MSDYIYNNFSSEDDKETKEPVNIYFEVNRNKNKKAKSKSFLIAICSICIILCAVFAILGTLFANYLYDFGNPANVKVVENTIYISPDLRTLPTSTSEEQIYYTVADVAAAVADTVVEIRTEYLKASSVWSYQYVQSGAGSGVIVGKYSSADESGYYIVTNAHVIEGASSNSIAERISITLRDGTQYKNVEVQGYDTDYDIAILKIKETKKLNCAVWINDDSLLKVGEEVVVIGNPLGNLGGSVTNGIISAIGREVNVEGNTMSLIQTNATINPGNSGGGLFNMNGYLIGIVNAKSSGTGIEGIGFAIPKKDAEKAARDIINYGYVKGKADIGVLYSHAQTYYIESKSNLFVGNLISLVKKGYNSNILKENDLIIEVNGVTVADNSTILEKTIKSSKIGDKIQLKVVRVKDNSGYDILTLDVSVMEYEP